MLPKFMHNFIFRLFYLLGALPKNTLIALRPYSFVVGSCLTLDTIRIYSDHTFALLYATSV